MDPPTHVYISKGCLPDKQVLLWNAPIQLVHPPGLCYWQSNQEQRGTGHSWEHSRTHYKTSFFPRSDWWLKCDNLLLLRARGQKLWLGYVFMQTMQRVHEMRNQIGALTKFYRSRESSSLKNSRKVSKVRVKEVEQPWNCSTLLFMFLGLRTLHLHREVFSLKGN